MRHMTILDDFLLNAGPLTDDDCSECQGVGEIEGEDVNRNGPYSVVMQCPACKGSGKIERDEMECDE